MSRICSVLIMLVSIAVLPLTAEYNRLGVPDSSAIREKIAESWFYPSYKNLKDRKPEVYSNSIGQRFQVRVEPSSETTFSVVVAPEVSLSYDVIDNGVMRKETVSEFIADACGSWILERNRATGKPVRIRFYFVQDGDVFIQFSRDSAVGNKTLSDYVIGGCYAARSVPCGIAFDRLYTIPFEDVLDLTERTLPWQYADIHPGQYATKTAMISRIRKKLPSLEYAAWGCYDESGNPVNTYDGKPRKKNEDEEKKDDDGKLSMDSNGFVKYIVDGIVESYSGSCTYVAPLLRETVAVNPLGYAGVRGESETLSLSLDWTRNLAAARLSVQTKKMYLYEESGVDVQIEPFSAEMTEKGIVNLSGYLKNSGYRAEFLPQVLYVLGVTEPTYFYLAAIRERIPGDPATPKESAEIYKFSDSAVIFPYFDKSGHFACVVFQMTPSGAKEMTLGAFVAEHDGCYVHLSRVLSSEGFNLR